MGVSASDDGKLFATISETGEGRVFDIVNFGMCFLTNFEPDYPHHTSRTGLIAIGQPANVLS